MPALDIYDVFKILFRRDELTKGEVRETLSKMEKEDNPVFKNKVRIFD